MAGRRSALIVANDRYDNEGLKHLRSPAADAGALAGVLGDPQIGGFDVQVVRNEPAHVISSRIEDLFSESRPDDVILLHFSCHGLKSESGELFLAATGTRPDRLGSTAVSAEFVQRCMRDSRSRSIVLLLDCCYGGAFSPGVSVRAGGDVDVLDTFRGGGRGRAVITASSAMEYAFEGERLTGDPAPSVFTAALVEGLRTGDADRDEDGWVALDELYDYVFDTVRDSGAKQTPRRSVEMQGDLYIARSTRQKPPPIPAPLRSAMTDPNMYTRIGAVSELRSLLDGPSAVTARQALEDIKTSDIGYVAQAAEAALEAAAAAASEAAAKEEGPAAEQETTAAAEQESGRQNARTRRKNEPKSAPWIWVPILTAGVIALLLGVVLLSGDTEQGHVTMVELHLGLYTAFWLLMAWERAGSARILPAAIAVAALGTLVWLLLIGESYLEYWSIVDTPLHWLWLVAGALQLAATIARRAPAVDLERMSAALALIWGAITLVIVGANGTDTAYPMGYAFLILATGAAWILIGLRRRQPS